MASLVDPDDAGLTHSEQLDELRSAPPARGGGARRAESEATAGHEH